jgi:capsular polysaccharide biosynthesis protein
MALPEKGPQGAVSRRVDGPGGPPSEIGLREIRTLLASNRLLIASCALAAGLLAAVVLVAFVPTLYVANAKLLATPLDEGDGRDTTGVGLYLDLATSDGVVERAAARLVTDGVLSADALLRIGHEIDAVEPERPRGAASNEPAFLDLLARHRDATTAATIANVWAAAVVEEAQELFRGTAAGSERLLEAQLEPTNVEIESAGHEFAQRLDELGKREEEATIGWDRRLSAARKSAEEAVASFNSGTRQLMEEAVNRLPSGPDSVGNGLRSRLQEILAVRSQLARTPRVLTLEKSASDDALSEMLAEGMPMGSLDGSLVTQEINPLHDQLTLRLLRLESELKSTGVGSTSRIDDLLVELERIQLERSASLKALEERNRLEQRVLQLRRGRAIEALRLEESRLRASYERKLKQLDGLADELSGRLGRSVVSRVLDDVEVVKLAVPASAPQLPMPKQLIVKLAIAVFLGGLLGLMIALFRSADARHETR